MALTQVSRGLLSTSIDDNGNATAITIDSSENVLVGKTSLAIANEGIVFENGGAAEFTTDSARVMRLNRTSDDGSVLEINKDGTTVGSIATISDDLTIFSTTASHVGLRFGNTRLQPTDNAGATSDGVSDLGFSNSRFKDFYLSGDIAHKDAADNARLLYDKSSNLLGNAGTNGTFATLLVGTTSSINSTNTIQKSGSSTNALVINNSSSSIPYGLQMRLGAVDPNNTTSTFYEAYGYNGTAFVKRFEVRSNGGIANYQANDANLSDERVKRDITPLSSMWDKFKALEIVTFKYKDQTHTNDNIGVIAQQVESVAPEFVSNDGFGETPEGEEPLKTIYTADLYHAAIKALQEAMTRIETLEAKVQQLETP